MSSYVTKFYPRTVFQTSNELELREKLKDLIDTCLDESGKFSDPDFGPKPSDPKGECSIFYPPEEQNDLQGDASVGALNNIAGLGIDMLQWLRPRDFCKDPNRCHFLTVSESESEGEDEEVAQENDAAEEKIKAILNNQNLAKDQSRGASSLDVMQGNLGDCWFISALALIAIRDDIFGNLICEDKFPEYEKYGLFVFRMFRNCRVHYVIVDDKVPCMERSNGQCIPAFARNRNPNEFWVSLVEKAYAKLNVRYINLTSGFIDEALQDLSGLAPEMIRFTNQVNKDAFWDTFKQLSYTDSLIGASLNFLGRRDIPDEVKRELQTEARHCGIQYGHAYGVLDVREVPDPTDPNNVYKMLRIKNPWGKDNNMEWNGKWHDADEMWTDEMKEAYNKVGAQHPTKFDKDEMMHVWGRNDNIFIMEFDDFLTYFNTLMAVRDFPDEWSGIRYFTSWSPSYGIPPRGKTWYKNPQFTFYIKKNTQISIRLQQPDPRSLGDNRPPFKKFVLLIVVFKIDMAEKSVEEFDPKKIILQSQGADSRSVMVGGDLKPGKYCIVLLNAVEGAVSDCYLSIYFNCTKDEIVFENKNWEVIREEEEEEQKLNQSKGKISQEAQKSLNSSMNKGLLEISKPEDPKKLLPPTQDDKNQKAKAEELKKTATISLEKSTKLDPNPEKLVKTTAFGKTVTKPASQVEQKPVSYTQAIKAMKKVIEESTLIEDAVRIVDPMSMEIQFETDMAIMFGLSYADYKKFYAIPTEQQEKIIEQYNIDKNRVATVCDLSYFGVGNKGLRALFGGIEDFPHLEFLYLKGNKLGETVVCDLCRRLELSRQLNLKEIDLSENPDIGDTAGLALYSLACAVTNIKKINLQGTSVTVKTLQKINDQTERNSKLIMNN